MLKRLLLTENSFLKIIVILFSISIFHLIAIGLGSGMPFALLYGPILYYAHLRLKGKRPSKIGVYLLFSFFIVASVWYAFLKVNRVSIEEMVRTYYLVYFISIAVSLFLSAVYILKQRHEWVKPISYLKSALIYQLSTISIIVSLTVSILVLRRWFDLELDVNPMYMIYMLTTLTVALLLRYTYQELSWELETEGQKVFKKPVDLNASNDTQYTLPVELLEGYAERLKHSLLNDKLYLRPGLSIQLLAQETNIPKHHFSELLNAYLGKSFYHLIAEYRIQAALTLMRDSGSNLTIEALAYECGFNSKTSFNKYFKEFTGTLPSEYRDLLVL